MEVPYLIKGFPVCFVDTAGLRHSDGVVEQKGVGFSHKYLEKADLVINIFDATENNGDVDQKDSLFAFSSTVPHIKVFNKVDLLKKRKNHKTNSEAFFTSALTGYGIDFLLEAIHSNLVGATTLSHQVIINSGRHQNALVRVRSCLKSIEGSLKREDPLDVVASDLRISMSILDELLGFTTVDDILDNIFSKFCVGK